MPDYLGNRDKILTFMQDIKELNTEEISEILKKGGVGPTAVRILVYKTLFSSRLPLSLNDIEEQLQTVDKSSISRALNQFRKNGLVHFFDDGSGSVKYEICFDPMHGSKDDTHAHFHCSVCGQTICMHSIGIPELHLPEGFEISHVNFIIEGKCPQCKHVN